MSSSGTYSIIGSSGELETYPDVYAGITPDIAEEAVKAEQEIIKRRDQVEQSFLEMAFLLDDFEAKGYFRGRGYASLAEWAEDPSVQIGKRVALDLLRMVREAVPALATKYDFEGAINALANAKISKTRAMLPLLSEGMQDEFLDLIERAPDMTWRDVNREVKILRKGDDNGDKMPAVFHAKVRRGDKLTRYQISVMDGQTVTDCGTLMIPNEHTSRWVERFGVFMEFELE